MSFAARVDVLSVAREAEHPVRDGIDERLQPSLALPIETDQQSDRDRSRCQIPCREEDRLDALGQVRDPADQVDDQAGEEDHPGDEYRCQLSTGAGRGDQPAPDDDGGGQRRERQATVETIALVGDDREARREEEIEGVAPIATIVTATRSTSVSSLPLG